MSTVKQKWAQERNFNKGSMVGIITHLRNIATDKSTILYERTMIEGALRELNHIFREWDSSAAISRNKFLRKWREKYET